MLCNVQDILDELDIISSVFRSQLEMTSRFRRACLAILRPFRGGRRLRDFPASGQLVGTGDGVEPDVETDYDRAFSDKLHEDDIVDRSSTVEHIRGGAANVYSAVSAGRDTLKTLSSADMPCVDQGYSRLKRQANDRTTGLGSIQADSRNHQRLHRHSYRFCQYSQYLFLRRC